MGYRVAGMYCSSTGLIGLQCHASLRAVQHRGADTGMLAVAVARWPGLGSAGASSVVQLRCAVWL